ncbi:MAG TPA: glycoside hydrolase family 3 C-terminal domain-containing protein [Steroidobacteraceae bacterium]|nr:glycoside hydrolase family 3 C-terminal domain-containing protein [Steroidobacteraceae bacterium]
MRILLIALLLLPICATADSTSSDDGVQQRVESILSRMTIEEKIDMLGGVRGFDVPGVPRLGVPSLATADGPFGVRHGSRSNVMAGGIALAATWNTALAEEVGREVGRDARARGVHFLLSPGMNIYRSPLNGRNFEYLGEDPWLASRLVVSFVNGVQSQGVAATAKHYVANDSEFARHTLDARIDERTLREIYLPPFEAAVREARVAAVMSSYNLVNGEHMTQNRHLNLEILKRDWKFAGVLMSDWGATYDTLAAANGGLDLEMPSGKYLNRATLMPLIQSGEVSRATIDDKVRRILTTMARFGWLDRPQLDASISVLNAQGRVAALQTAREGIVLLKNERGVLPLDASRAKRIAVIGPGAYPAVPHGGGSVTVVPFHAVSFLEGVSTRAGTTSVVQYARGIPELRRVARSTAFETAASGGKAGLTVEQFDNADLAGPPASTTLAKYIDQGAPLDLTPLALGEFESSLTELRPQSARWTGFHKPARAGAQDVFVQVGGFGRRVGYRLYVDDRLVLDHWNLKKAALDMARLDMDASAHKVVLEYHCEPTAIDGAVPFVRLGIQPRGAWVEAAALELAAKADVVVLAAGFDASSETEDWDRTFALPPGQDELIEAVAARNPNTVLVLTSGGGVDMSGWLERIPAVLQTWYPGQEGGTALAEILFGDVNPSGHLPVTFERRWEDNPVYGSYYPQSGTPRAEYREGVFVGYRGYESKGTQPLFAFGHGLSYTRFKYDALTVVPVPGKPGSQLAELSITNVGERPGAAVAQLYVSPPPSAVPRPPKELKGFAKVVLQPGESRRVAIPLDARSFAYYDVKHRRWQADPGTYRVLVGDSSDHADLAATVTLRHALRATR